MKKLLLILSIFFLFPAVSTFAYPGCDKGDLIVGGQIWASCNSTTKGSSSSAKSGWFLSGDMLPAFLSYNGWGARLEFLGKYNSSRNRSANIGPCAKGYRLPTRGEWETAIFYARLNSVSLSALLGLPENGSYTTYRDTDGDMMVESRNGVRGAYWSSTRENIYGTRQIVLHLGANYYGSNMDGTDGVYVEPKYTWQYEESGLELVGGEESEMANVRCIRS